jgi:hypothetical protein
MQKLTIVLFSLLSGISFSFAQVINQELQSDLDPTALGGTTNASQCIQLTKSFGRGARDTDFNNEVSLLQDFLSPKYLQVEPTGYFGAMTFTALQTFQKDSGFSQTGYVGPLTRGKIKDLTCGGGSSSQSGADTGTANTTSSNTQTSNITSNSTTGSTLWGSTSGSYINTGDISISFPRTGQVLANTDSCGASADSYCLSTPLISTIRWVYPGQGNVTISLYDQNGGRVKTIASNTPNSGSYEWRYDPTLGNGRYKIVIQANGLSGETGYFNINSTGISSSVQTTTITRPNTQTTNPVNTQTNTTTGDTFKAPDLDVNGNPILPTTKPSIIVSPEAFGAEVPFTNLPNNAPLSKLFQTTIDIEKTGYVFRNMSLPQEYAVTYRLDIPSWYDGGWFRVMTEQGTQGRDYPRMVTISETRGDFDTVKAKQSGASNLPLDNCYVSYLHPNLDVNVSKDGRIIYEYERGGALRNVITQTTMTPAQIAGMKKAACIVKPGKTYYVNVRFTVLSGTPEFKTADGCAFYNKQERYNNQTVCGTLVQFQSNANINVLKQLAGITPGASTSAGDISTDGITIPNPSKVPYVTPTHGGLSGAGDLTKAYAMNPSRCITNVPLSASWQHSIDIDDFVGKSAVEKFELKPNEALTYKFTPTQTGSYVLYYDQTTHASNAPTFLSVSSAPCDFNLTKLSAANASTCYASRGNGVPNQVSFNVGSTESISGTCALKTGNTYYFNIRNQDATRPTQDACETDGVAVNGQKLCGGLVSFSKTQ